MQFPSMAESHADADRFHPGPGASYTPPPVVIETPHEKLERMERTFLEKAIDRAIQDRYTALAS